VIRVPLQWLLGRKTELSIRIDRETAENIVGELNASLANPDQDAFVIAFASNNWQPNLAVGTSEHPVPVPAQRNDWQHGHQRDHQQRPK
jgi:hypothetical protein